MTTAVHDLSGMLRLAARLGPMFGSEDSALLLHGLAKMQRPEVAVELGTGVGVSAMAIATALQANGHGMLYTVDDLQLLAGDERYLPAVVAALDQEGFDALDASDPAAFFSGLAEQLGVAERCTLLSRRIDLADHRHFDDYPFAKAEIGLVFSDFQHGPDDVLALLGAFLPRMAPVSSLLIDSVPNVWTSYLVLEHVVSELGAGRVPAALQERCGCDLREFAATRDVRLVHLHERKPRDGQNACSWIQLQPRDVRPPARSGSGAELGSPP